MPSELAHNRHTTTFLSLPREASCHNNPQKYFIIDSQNEDDLSYKKQVKYKESTPSSFFSKRRSSLVVKSRGQSLGNFMPFQIYPQAKNIDLQIKQTQKQICWLQKQCKLLESMINDMAVQQAKILVETRSKERRLTAQKDKNVVIGKKSCPIHSEIVKKLEKMNEKVKKINQSVLIEQIKSEISLTTPLFSANLVNPREMKNLDEAISIDASRRPLKAKVNNSVMKDNKKLSNKRKSKKTNTWKQKQNDRISKSKNKF